MSTQHLPGFADMPLAPELKQTLQRIGYEQPTPIQAETIPPLLEGRDLLGTAQTGTGKTAAFALPLLTRLDLRSSAVQVLVLAPTRELAIQVAEAFQTYAAGLANFHVLPIYGGQSMSTQLHQLRRGAQVVVGTPGRVMDHLRRGTLKLDGLRSVVLDEADEMLRMGFIDDVTWILEQMPEQRQVALFSATMPKQIRAVADTYLRDPVVVKIGSASTTVDKTDQFFWLVQGVAKLDALTRMLEVEPCDGIIIFVRTRVQTVNLAQKLEARGFSAAPINGDMSQQAREQAIESLKSGRLDILVATDVVARGIDVARISHVINYDIPHDTEAYVHRIGRTGRAGRAGKAILFVAPREQRMLRTIEKSTRSIIRPLQLPSAAQVQDHRESQLRERLVTAMQSSELQRPRALVESLVLETGADPLQVAAACLSLLKGGRDAAKPADEKDDSPTHSAAQRPSAGQSRERTRSREQRDERPREPRPEKSRKPRQSNFDSVRYRVAVGTEHGATPADLVGAIANEAGIDSAYIGRIELQPDHSIIELPDGMPKEIFQHLRKVRVRNQPLAIELFDAGSEPPRKRDVRKPASPSTKGGQRPPGKRKPR